MTDLPQKRPLSSVSSTTTDPRRSPYTPVFHLPAAAPPTSNGNGMQHSPLAASTGAISRPASPATLPAAAAAAAAPKSASRRSSPSPATAPPASSQQRNTEADLRARLFTESKRLHDALASKQPSLPPSPSSIPTPTPPGPPAVRLSMSENVKLAISGVVTSGLPTEQVGPLLALLTSVLEDAVGFEYARMAQDAAEVTGGKGALEEGIGKVLAAVGSLEQQLLVRLPRPAAKPVPPPADPTLARSAPQPPPPALAASVPASATAPTSRTASQDREREDARLRLKEEKERARERDRARERERAAEAYDPRPAVVAPPYRPLAPHRPYSPPPAPREPYYPPPPIQQPFYGAYGPPPPGVAPRYDDVDRRMPPRDLEDERRRDWEDRERERMRYSAGGRAGRSPPPGARGPLQLNGGPPR